MRAATPGDGALGAMTWGQDFLALGAEAVGPAEMQQRSCHPARGKLVMLC